ncbi:HNH endonuclease [Shewanella mangrovi]|uniref:HNH endonuclease n=1 Tax=Shewanella mangrovi TaxID=1515746 RepID=UPI000689AAF4|nr:HNH endonuclease [Shewanella mangrovi]
MAHIPEEAHVVAYYLAKFPDSYKNLEPNKNMTSLLISYSRFFCMPDSSLKRLRDEYDAFFPHRAGYKGADKRGSRIKVHMSLNNLSESELHDRVLTIVNEDSAVIPEVETNASLLEGKCVKILVNKFERNRYARAACLEHYGFKCQCCLNNMKDIYGSIAEGLVEVHHITPISEIGVDYQIDPIADLVPLCPNCHRVVHKRNPPYTVEEVRSALKNITSRSN